MSFVAVAIGGSAVAGIGGALISSNAAKDASNAQVGLGQQSLAQQQQFGQQSLAQQNALSQQGLATLLQMFNTAQTGIQPAFAAGQNLLDTGKGIIGTGQGILDAGRGIVDPASATLKALLTPGANQTATLSQLPGFQFAQDWGQKAVANQATTTGLGGNQLKAGADYATGVAQQGFSGLAGLIQSYLNSGNQLAATGAGTIASGAGTMASGAGTTASAANALAGAATGAGSSAFGNLTQTGGNIAGSFSNLGSQVGNTLTGIGNSQASGIMGSANALSGGLQGIGNTGVNALLLNKLLSPSGAASNPGIYSANTLSTLSSTSPGDI